MRFLGNVLATLVGLFLFCMIFFFGIVFIGAIAGSAGSSVPVKSDAVIELDISKVTNDYGGKSRYPEFNHFEVNHDGLSNILAAIEAAETDDKIKGISIINNNSALGAAQSKALRDQLEKFKKSGKFIYSYADVYTQKDYYLNSVADQIYINPIGSMEFRGLSTEVMFFKDLQEKSGIKLEVVRHGKYKSAVEPFLQNEMSDSNREQITSLISSVWHSLLTDISKSRNISTTRLNEIADGLLARNPEMAKQEKLIDRIEYEDVYHSDIRKALKLDENAKKYNKIKILDYAKNVATTGKSAGTSDKIAIIYAQGEILSGEGDENYIGEGSIRRALKAVREDKNVKAVVLRIDSPGGSALTADLIWREIELTRKVKPVVTSMGNLAASGGYYIACNSNTIFAEEQTITGSIGVFGMLPNLTALSSRIGIHTQQVVTNKNAAGYSPFVPIDENFKAVTQEEVERVYTTFINRVAAGRDLSIDDVDKVAQGRVWSGTEALQNGLVDKIGGLDDAIAEAAKLAKIEKYKTVDYPEYDKNFQDLLASMGVPFMKSKSEILLDELGPEAYRLLQEVKMATKTSGVQALMPFKLQLN